MSDILNQLSNVEPQYLLDEIDNAMAGKDYEEFYSVDGSLFNDGVQINPPNAIINNTFEVSLTDLKGLLEEWILFCNT